MTHTLTDRPPEVTPGRMSRDASLYLAAVYMTAGWTSERLPDAVHPEVADAILALTAQCCTAVTAAEIVETGMAPAPVPSPRTAPDGAPVAA